MSQTTGSIVRMHTIYSLTFWFPPQLHKKPFHIMNSCCDKLHSSYFEWCVHQTEHTKRHSKTELLIAKGDCKLKIKSKIK